MLAPTYTGFIDAGFLRAEGARALGESPRNVRLDAEAVVAWFKDVAYRGAGTFLRAYWYDASFEQGHDHADGQRRFFTALSQTAGIQLRLGRIVEHRPWFEPGIRDAIRRTATGLGLEPSAVMDEFDKNWTFRPERRQKGVDTLVALDLVRLSSRRVLPIRPCSSRATGTSPKQCEPRRNWVAGSWSPRPIGTASHAR